MRDGVPQAQGAQTQSGRGSLQERAGLCRARLLARESCAHGASQARVELVEPLRMLAKPRARMRAGEAS
jgi:hypothetical protein